MTSPITKDASAAQKPPAPVVRRGRGTFKHQLHTEELERQSAAADGRAEEASTIITAATTTVVLPSSSLGPKATRPVTEEEELVAQYAHLKKGKDIPLDAVPVMPAAGASSILAPASDTKTTRERMIAAAIAAAEARANAPRTQFGLFENNTNDTARQLLFRNEKRRRYCVIIGDLQSQTRQVTLKLFGHKGEKPFKLQNKLIRLVNLSIGKPRRGTAQDLAARAEREAEEEEEEAGEETRKEDEDEDVVLDAAAPDGTPALEEMQESGGMQASAATDTMATATVAEESMRQRVLQRETHAAAGFDVDEAVQDPHLAVARDEAMEKVRLAADTAAAAADAVPLPESDSDTSAEEAEPPSTAAAASMTAAALPAAPPPVLPAYVPKSDAASSATHADPASTGVTAAAPLPPQAINTKKVRIAHHLPKGAAEVEGENVDHYLDEDEVVPLTVQQAGTSTSVMYENSIANSPVLTARRFSALHDYFLREFRLLLNLEDVRTQNVSVKINLGAAYCCLARQGSYSTPLKHATFGEFVERMNTESMQLYFIRDCPACVSRAVDMESGSLNFPASTTTVKINFFSNERQSRSIARAVWDSDEDQFRLLDVENIGVTFNWSVFSLDETFVRRKRELMGEAAAAAATTMGGDSNSSFGPSAVGPPSANASYRTAAAKVPPPPVYRSPAAGAAARARIGPAPVGIGMDLAAPVHRNDDDDSGALAAAGRPASVSNGGGVEHATAATAPADSDAPSLHMSSTAAAVAEDDDDEDDLARNKTVAYPFEVEFRAFRRWKQQGDNPAAPLAKAILEELSLAEHNYLSHGSSVAYERMDLTNVCEVDYAADDLNVESIVVEHTSRVKPEGTDLFVDNTTSLYIENFAAARQLKDKVRAYGPVKTAAMQNPNNNNKMHAICAERRAEGHGGSRDGLRLTPEEMREVLMPISKLTFFRSRGSTIHWKLRPNCSLEENIAPMTEALSFLQQVLHTANDIERTSARGGAAPNAL
ncbi:hypothetical protein ABB37_00877 [Leptomonas pyrrhocoris]|uniref:Uncharacterized protein n=1 Tax=Leptomonas pyrrhocoris TaxID=157538 RepID=A0A0N0E0T7_LEPPY|nr:hypothetical protein ABB37_00877 [Leptomonas pyrrhocoris]KPA86822.1 hypothetical protein ABB37_00877 [Leptomonas pyrrhocoris]|eukprot:XP_015665261.1 hypothetical protein ABB37_00877 [Leptomonas pyrrhocoris]